MRYNIYYSEQPTSPFDLLWPEAPDMSVIEAEELSSLVSNLRLEWDAAMCCYTCEEGSAKGLWKFVLAKEEGAEHE